MTQLRSAVGRQQDPAATAASPCCSAAVWGGKSSPVQETQAAVYGAGRASAAKDMALCHPLPPQLFVTEEF